MKPYKNAKWYFDHLRYSGETWESAKERVLNKRKGRALQDKLKKLKYEYEIKNPK
jgi:hypothetical protein